MIQGQGEFYSTLRAVTRAYGRALESYERAMRFGETDKADAAFSRMQEIERDVTVIVRPGASL